jgi:hypothetical protein
MAKTETDYRGSPFPVRRAANVVSPSTGLHPEMLNTKVSSTTCAVFNTKPLIGRGFKGSCPVQWIWKNGKPALRFCTAKGKPGRVIPVTDAADALQKARKLCAEWDQKKTKRPRQKNGRQYQILAEEMSARMPKYALGKARRSR